MGKVKETLLRKLNSLRIVAENADAFRAYRSGCYLTVFEQLNRFRRMGIQPSTYVDIGANRGVYCRTMRFLFPQCEIFAIEPLADCYKELEEIGNEIGRMQSFNVAAGSETGEVRINHNSYDYSSSILEMGELHKNAFPNTACSNPEVARMERLDDLLGGKELPKPILMKIDVQGYEARVIEGASQVLGQTSHLLCELSFKELYKGQPLFDEVYSQLVHDGFQFAGVLGGLEDPATGQTFQIDAYFTRQI